MDILNKKIALNKGKIALQNYKPASVNWHLSPICNYHCKYCFGHFRDIKNFLGLKASKYLLEHLSLHGTEKISFSGGEPLLCPYLEELLVEAKDLGMTTMIISNGSLITEEWLNKNARNLDWLGLSIDSSLEEIQLKLGRGNGNLVEIIDNLAILTRNYNINLKINTVVTKYNWKEDMNAFIKRINPQRWKIFRFLPINGENENYISELQINENQFQFFTSQHQNQQPVVEDNSDMYGSYLMIDPNGRLFQNTHGFLYYSKPILDIGINCAIKDLSWDYDRFLKRGGYYNWRK